MEHDSLLPLLLDLFGALKYIWYDRGMIPMPLCGFEGRVQINAVMEWVLPEEVWPLG